MDRRRFLLLLGGSSAGLVLAGQGIIVLPHRMALVAGGRCSFCLGVITPHAVVGMVGSPARICDACVALLHSVLEPRDLRVSPPVSASGTPSEMDAVLSTARRASTDANSFAALRSHLRLLAEHDGLDASVLDSATAQLAQAISAAPTAISPRLGLGDILARAQRSDLARAQYTLVATVFRAQGFLLKSLAMHKQCLRLGATNVSRAELAELFERLGMHAEAASERALCGEIATHCSFCSAPREVVRILTGHAERICASCLAEASELLQQHQRAG